MATKKKSPAKKSKIGRTTAKRAPKKKVSVKTTNRLSARSDKAGVKNVPKKTRVAAKKKSRARRAKLETSFPIAEPVRRPVSDDDAQGLSTAESVDSESVSELVDEGNAFEAGAVSGVEEADDADEREVRTHEVSEDDVPEEYLDQD